MARLTSSENRRSVRVDTEVRKFDLANRRLLSDAKEFC